MSAITAQATLVRGCASTASAGNWSRSIPSVSCSGAARPSVARMHYRGQSAMMGAFRRIGSRSTIRPVFAAEDEAEASEEAAVEEAADEEEAVVEEEEEEEAVATTAFTELLEKLTAAGVDDELLGEVETELATTSIRASGAAAEADKFKDQYLRLNADFDNFRKRNDREKEALQSRIKGQTLEDLLPVLDNFELAASQIKASNEGEEKIVKGYQALATQMLDVIGKMGMKPVPGKGSPFDPTHHEAIMKEESVDFEDGEVMEVFRSGYAIGDQLLRPAMVKVAVNAAEGGAPADEEPAAENVIEDVEE